MAACANEGARTRNGGLRAATAVVRSRAIVRLDASIDDYVKALGFEIDLKEAIACVLRGRYVLDLRRPKSVWIRRTSRRARTRTRTSILVVAIAATVSSAALAQPELPPATTDAQAQLVERITELRATDGPTPATVIEPLQDLATLYEEQGEHAFAVAALEEARHVTRIHRGLASAEEALLLRQQVRSEEALGLDERVWDLQQEMLTIARQHMDDVRMAPIFRDLAEDRSDVLERYRSGGYPPEIRLGCYYSTLPRRYDDTRGHPQPPLGGSCRAGNSHDVVRQLRSEILMYYADAIEVIVKNADYTSRELRELEKQAYRVSAFFVPGPSRCPSAELDDLLDLGLTDTCLEPVIHDGDAVIPNVGGWMSLVRLIAYEIRSAAPAAARANAIAELADWQLLAIPAERRRLEDRTEVALELYERAYRQLQQGSDKEASAQIFAPELPVTLPTFAPNPFDSAATTDPSSYIDVSFVVTKHGRGEQIEILDASENATRGDARDLIRLIESTSFRPRFIDGELAAAAPVSVHYQFAADTSVPAP